jgi:hypothetical protein
MNTISQLARTYRNMCKQVQLADERIKKAKAHVAELSKERFAIMQELEHMRLLMDYCVITGENPTQAKLSHTLDQMSHVVSEHRRHMRVENDFYYTSSGSTVTINSAGSGTFLGAHTVTNALSKPLTSNPTISGLGSHHHNLLNDEVDLIDTSNHP